MSQTLHVVPVDDLIDHNTDTDDCECICCPVLEYVEGSGGDRWLIVHSSLDGRELEEA